MSIDQFFNQYNGKAVDWDGYYGPQCVDLIKYYMRDVTGNTGFAGNAKDWFHNYPNSALVPQYERITNNPNDLNQIPKRGDIVIWDGTLPGSGGYGHIAVYDAKVAPGRFRSFDQNWGGQYCHFVEHNYNHLLGWLTPRATAPQGGDTTMNRDEEANAYRIVLGREMEHGGSGRTGYKFILDGKPEIESQRASKQNEINTLKSHINGLNQTITALNADDAADEATIKDALAKIGELTNQLEETTDKLNELENNPKVVYTHDVETKNKIDSIYNYFVGQYKSFLKYIKK